MIKSLNKSDILVTPFEAQKNWEDNDLDPSDLILWQSQSIDVNTGITSSLTGDISVMYIDYGDNSINYPTTQSYCELALQQQDLGFVHYQKGVLLANIQYPNANFYTASSINYNPLTNPRNIDGTYMGLIYEQNKHLFYNNYNNFTKTFGMEGADLSITNRNLTNTMDVFTIPQVKFGETLIPNTINIIDKSFDKTYNIIDDGNCNLIFSGSVFSKFQVDSLLSSSSQTINLNIYSLDCYNTSSNSISSIVTSSFGNTNLFNANSSTINAVISGGVAPYNYYWSVGGDFADLWSVYGEGPNIHLIYNNGIPSSTLNYSNTYVTCQVIDDIYTEVFSNELYLQTCNINFLPTGAIVLTVTSGSAILAWNYTDTNQSGFNIEKSTDGIIYTKLQTSTDFRNRSYVDTAVSGGTTGNTYWYRVNAYNSYGTSSYSNVSSIYFAPSGPIVPISERLLADIDGYFPADVDIPNTNILSGYSGIINLNNNSYTFLSALDCTNLLRLNCSNNNLTLLNLNGATSLNTLSCSYNSLTSLDLSSNTLLNALSCSYNSLTSLDIDSNTALKILDCSNNPFTTPLNLNYNTALTNLNCYNDSLSVLDVSSNTVLKYLNCSNNSLSSLNLNANTLLTNLSCSNNLLTSVDINGAISLQNINCSNNLLPQSSVDSILSEWLNPRRVGSIVYLNGTGNDEPSVNGWAAVSVLTSLTTWKRLTTVYVNGTGPAITSVSGYFLADIDGYFPASFALTNNDLLYPGGVLNLSNDPGNIINGAAWKFISAKDCTNLTTLSARNCALTSIDLSGTSALTNLSCSNNLLTSLNVSDSTALTNLYCDHNALTSLNVSTNTALTTLNCNNNNSLTSLNLGTNTVFKHLNCSYTGIASFTPGNYPLLEYLDCSYSGLSNLDLSTNTALKFLNCNYWSSLNVDNNTALEHLGCTYGAFSSLNVINNTELKVLDCSGCLNLTSLDLSTNTNLTYLACHGTDFPLNLSNNTALETLICYAGGRTSLDISNLPVLNTVLAQNSALTSVNISNSKKLKTLWLQQNALTQPVVDDILAKLVEYNIFNGTLILDRGTNAAPSSKVYGSNYYILKNIRGWNVSTN